MTTSAMLLLVTIVSTVVVAEGSGKKSTEPSAPSRLCDSNFLSPWGRCGGSPDGDNTLTRCRLGQICVADYKGARLGHCTRRQGRSSSRDDDAILCPVERRQDTSLRYIFLADPDTCELGMPPYQLQRMREPRECPHLRLANCGRDVKHLAGKCGPKFGHFRCDTGEICDRTGHCVVADQYYEDADCEVEKRPPARKFVRLLDDDSRSLGHILPFCDKRWFREGNQFFFYPDGADSDLNGNGTTRRRPVQSPRGLASDPVMEKKWYQRFCI